MQTFCEVYALVCNSWNGEATLTSQVDGIDTGTPDLLAKLHGKVLILTMHRPAARNAFSPAMLEALEYQLALAEFDDRVGCIVLTGAEGAFCAGGDVKAMAAEQEGRTGAAMIQHQRKIQRGTAGKLFAMLKPTIAAINGPAAGAGLSLALACDLRTISSETFFTTAFAKVGLSGDFGGTYFLSQLVGTSRAREICYLSERVPAVEALQLGLVNRVFGREQLLAETLVLAERLASGPTIALGYMKDNLNRALLATPEECLDLEATNHIYCTTTRDHEEAASAFVSKRQPVFEGR